MIQIIKGTYGLETNGIVRPMTKHCEPFKLTAAREAELVAAGVAVYVEETTENKIQAVLQEETGEGVRTVTKRGRKKRQEATDEL